MPSFSNSLNKQNLNLEKGLSTSKSSSSTASLKETEKHSVYLRTFCHNYFAPFIYQIILHMEKAFERLGKVKEDERIKYGNPSTAWIKESEIGKIIAKVTTKVEERECVLCRFHKF